MSLIPVQIGNSRIRVPEVGDPATTQRIADAVSAKLKEIEEEAERIDTHAFALQAAFSFAAEAHALRGEQERDERDLALALDRVLSRLQELREDFGQQLK